MRVLSTRYRTIARLESFIKSNILNTSHDIFIQILLPSKNTIHKESFKDIDNLLKKYFEKKSFFAISTDGALLNSAYVEDIVINFFLIKKDSASIVYSKNLYESEKFESDFLYILFSIDFDKKKFLKTVDETQNIVGSFYHDFIYHDSKVLDSGAVYVKVKKYFDMDISVVKSIEPIGRELKVDTCSDGYISKIEGFQPKDLYKHYLTQTMSKDLKISSHTFPLLKIKQDGYESSLVLDQKDDAVRLEYEVEPGDILKLGYTESSSFYKDYEKVLDRYNDTLSDLFFIISSISKKELFKQNGFEFEDALGFFTKSEVVVFGGEIYDLTHSVIMINISYESKRRLKKIRFKSLKPFVQDFQILDALANIAKISSLELEKLNKKLEKKVKIEVEKNLKKDSILIHRSRLAQMGEMISLIAHQWKQPLSAISATSSGLHIKIELGMYDKEFFLKSLTKIEEFVNHLSTTIDDFSNFFKPSKTKKEFYIYEAIDKALSIATYSLSKKSIDLVLDIDKNLKIKTFQNELVQVLLNLIKNAENILIKREIKNPKIQIKLYEDNGKKIIEISDNGGGIDKKIISKIFEPYFSTKATKDSTGLGLYMSQFIVKESLGGELKVRNSDNGAVFSILLV